MKIIKSKNELYNLLGIYYSHNKIDEYLLKFIKYDNSYLIYDENNNNFKSIFKNNFFEASTNIFKFKDGIKTDYTKVKFNNNIEINLGKRIYYNIYDNNLNKFSCILGYLEDVIFMCKRVNNNQIIYISKILDLDKLSMLKTINFNLYNKEYKLILEDKGDFKKGSFYEYNGYQGYYYINNNKNVLKYLIDLKSESILIPSLIEPNFNFTLNNKEDILNIDLGEKECYSNGRFCSRGCTFNCYSKSTNVILKVLKDKIIELYDNIEKFEKNE